jgi:hypothetical protein
MLTVSSWQIDTVSTYHLPVTLKNKIHESDYLGVISTKTRINDYNNYGY